jgi:hypothetical protein
MKKTSPPQKWVKMMDKAAPNQVGTYCCISSENLGQLRSAQK